MKEIKQKHLFTKKEFLLTPKGIRVISKAINENLEYTIKYEELGFDIIKKRDKTAIVPAILLSFFLCSIFTCSSMPLYTAKKPHWWLCGC